MSTIFLSLALTTVHALASVINKNEEDCTNLWLINRPDLANRFSRDQIRFLCQHTIAWMKNANAPPKALHVTGKQLEWLNKLRVCEGSNCLRDVVKCTGQRCIVKPKGPAHWMDRTAGLSLASYGWTYDRAQSFNMDIVTRDILINEDQCPNICRKREEVAQLCSIVSFNENGSKAFDEDNLRLDKVQNRQRVRQQMQLKFNNFKNNCNSMMQRLQAKNLTLDDVKGCPDGMAPKDLSISSLASHCETLLRAKSPEEVLPQFVTDVKNTYQKNHYLERYGVWLDRCRSFKDMLAKEGVTLQYIAEGHIPSRSQSMSTAKPCASWVEGNRTRRIRSSQQVNDPLSQRVSTLFQDAVSGVSTDQRAYRKEYRMMTDEERRRFHAAMNKLKKDLVDGHNKYDLFIMYHTPGQSPEAHWGPAFLPFHRELLKQFEIALRQVDPLVALPYWDSTMDQALPDPKDSIVWTDDFFGNGDKVVTSGPYGNWRASQELSFVPGMTSLYRDVGQSPFGRLMNNDDVNYALTRNKFEELTHCIDPTFELVHGFVHTFVGGFMFDVGISPNDPAFFAHHCFIDYIFEEFRQTKQNPTERETDYPAVDVGKGCTAVHFGNATMKPFSIKNVDGLSNIYTKELFYYQPRPTCSQNSQSCSSPYLYCERKKFQCMSKIKPGGNCTGYTGTEICYQGQCDANGRCSKFDTTTTSVVVTMANPTTMKPSSVSTKTSAVTVSTSTTGAALSTVPGRTTKCRPPTAAPTTPQPSTLAVQIMDEFVYFTCTVQHNTRDVRIKVSNGDFQGRLLAETIFPSYKGAAMFKVKNPGQTTSDIKIEVLEQGTVCEPRCFDNRTHTYETCKKGFIRVSTSVNYSDVVLRRTENDALMSRWTYLGYYRSRLPDYCYFQCMPSIM